VYLGLTILLTRLSAPPPLADLDEHTHLSIVAFFLTVLHSDRYSVTERHISGAGIPPTVDFSYWWVNLTQWNDTARHFLYPPDEYRELMLSRPMDLFGEVTDKDGELAANMWFSLRFFLENSTARWFYRGNDDSAINFNALEGFLARLESAYNPLKEFVFLGNCIHNEQWTWPQGGSGYLLSRAAVQAFAPRGRDFMRVLKKPEDMAFDAFFESIGRNISSITSPAFCGHSFGVETLDRIHRKAWALLEPCPDTIPSQFCTPFLAPLRDIVFYHEWNKSHASSIANLEAIASADSSVLWYMDGQCPHVCRGGSDKSGLGGRPISGGGHPPR
jgi:hypothetical protein